MRAKLSVGALLLLIGVTLLLVTPALASGGEPRRGVSAVAHVTSRLASTDFASSTDLVFLAEGYAEGEEDRFLADARAMTERLERSKAAEPMRAARVFNHHFVFVPSEARASAASKAAKTAFRARVEEDRVLVDAARVNEAVRLAADADVTITLVRFARAADTVRATARIPRFEGETFEEGRITIPSGDADDFLHELAHALWALGDEYAENDEPLTDGRRAAVAERANLTTDRTGARWRWVGQADRGRLDRPHEGAGRLKRGVFRSERDCLMRDLAAPGFCAVCRAVLSGAFDVDPADPVSLEVAQGPLKGNLLVAGVPVSIKWRAGGPTPVTYALVLVRISRRADEVATRVLEGHELAATLEGLEPGRYELRLQSRNVAPRRGSWVTLGFTVANASPGPHD